MPKINYPNVTKEKMFSSEWSHVPGLNIKGWERLWKQRGKNQEKVADGRKE